MRTERGELVIIRSLAVLRLLAQGPTNVREIMAATGFEVRRVQRIVRAISKVIEVRETVTGSNRRTLRVTKKSLLKYLGAAT